MNCPLCNTRARLTQGGYPKQVWGSGAVIKNRSCLSTSCRHRWQTIELDLDQFEALLEPENARAVLARDLASLSGAVSRRVRAFLAKCDPEDLAPRKPLRRAHSGSGFGG